MTTDTTSWEDRFKRRALEFIGVPENVDLSTVTIRSHHDEGYFYSEHTQRDPYFETIVTWRDTHAKSPFANPAEWSEANKVGYLYEHQCAMTDDDAARFLNLIIDPAGERTS